MKKCGFKSILSLLMVLAAMLSFSAAAYAAESGVTFEDGKIIAFEPGSVYTDSDLFDGFKGLMPGDTRTEEVTIQNKSRDCDYIKVYMRAVPHGLAVGNQISDRVLAELEADTRRGATPELDYMNAFLAQLDMKVWNGGTLIYEESPEQMDGLAANVYLGTLRQGESLKLNVELNVPIAMGNEYAGRIGEVDWVFVVEGYDETKLTVRKVWEDDGKDRPDSIEVNLLRDGEAVDKVELNKDNQWTHTWDRLDIDREWSVEEVKVPEGYKVGYKTEGTMVTIINTENEPDPEPADPVDLTVIKKWDDNGKNRPDSVKVTLYDGEKAVDTVYLGDWNNWTHTWNKLDGNGNWQVIETYIPGGYTPSYSWRNGVVTITNTATLIQTGQLNWPIAVMGGLGLLLIAYGFIIMMKKRKNDRA